MNLTRKSFLELAALAALAGRKGFCADGCKCSVYKGIPIGVITYSYRSMKPGAGKTLEYVLGSNLSTIELMSNDVEIDAGAPMCLARAGVTSHRTGIIDITGMITCAAVICAG